MEVYQSLPLRQLEIGVNMHCDPVDKSLSILRAGLEEKPDANKGGNSGCHSPCRSREVGRLTLLCVPDYKWQNDAVVLYRRRTPRTEIVRLLCVNSLATSSLSRWPGHHCAVTVTPSWRNTMKIWDLVKYTGGQRCPLRRIFALTIRRSETFFVLVA
jgi:hypothetical protein